MGKNKMIAGLIGAITVAAMMSPTSANAAEYQDVSAAMAELGISADNQNTILDNLSKGILPESDISGSVPVSQDDYTSNGFTHQRLTYSDGSVRKISREIGKTALSRAGIAGCSVSSGSGYVTYTNCTVSNSTPLVTMGFLADYGLVQGGYNDYIYRVRSAMATCYAGACSDYQLAIVKKYETTTGSAYARMSLIYTLWGGVASSNYTLVLYVGRNTSWAVG